MVCRCALAVLAAGLSLTRDNVLALCRSAGLPEPDGGELEDLLLLVRALEFRTRASPAAGSPPSGGSGGIVGEVVAVASAGPGADCVPPADPGVSLGRSSSPPADPLPGRYLYGVVEVSGEPGFSASGVEGRPVYLVVRDGLGAVVHACSPEPYSSDDGNVVASWVQAHNGVLEDCISRFGSVVPCAFNTILFDAPCPDGDEAVRRWLAAEADSLMKRLDRVRGRAEYGIQVLWDLREVGARLAEGDPELAQLRDGIERKPAGAGYLHRARFEKLLKERLEAEAARVAREVLGDLAACCADVKVDRNKREEGGLRMVLNLSCLASPQEAERLGSALDEVAARPGYRVRFTGPWPPYSFAGP